MVEPSRPHIALGHVGGEWRCLLGPHNPELVCRHPTGHLLDAVLEVTEPPCEPDGEVAWTLAASTDRDSLRQGAKVASKSRGAPTRRTVDPDLIPSFFGNGVPE